MQILGGGALPRTYTSGNWPITAFNSGRYRFVWTPTAANTDASWGGDFYCITASSGTPSGTDAGGLWIVNDALELYNQTGIVFSQALTWGAGAVITITVDLIANQVTISGASTGNGTFGFTDSGTYFTAGTLGVGVYGGGGFNLPASTISAFDDTVPEPVHWTRAPEPVRRPSRVALLAAGVVAPVLVSAPPPTVPDLSWSSEFPDMVRRAPAAVNAGGAFAPAATLPNPTTPPLVSFPDQVPRARPVVHGLVASPPFDTSSPSPTPDRWAPSFPDLVYPRPRPMSSVVEPLPDDGQPLLEWRAVFPDRFPARQMPSLGFLGAPPSDVSNPAPAPDLRRADFPDRIPPRARPLLVGGATPVNSAISTPLSVGVAAVRQRVNALNPPTGTFTTYGTDAAISLVVNSTDTFTSVGHTIVTGDGPFYYRVSAGGTFPGGLDGETPYYGIRITDDTFQLAEDAARAVAGTQIDITDDGTGTHTLVRTVTSDLAGGAFLTFVARGQWSTSPNAPTDNKGNTYTATPGSPRAYDGFPTSQAGVYVDLTGNGGPAHTFSATWGDIGGSGDEVTIAGLHIPGARILQDASVVERANGSGATITSSPVTCTARARLVLFVAGNGPVGQDHTFTGLDGFTEVLGASAKGDISGNGYIQVQVFTKLVATRGTYTARVQGTNSEGAQLFLLALQAEADETPPLNSWYSPPADLVRRVRRVEGVTVGPVVVPAPTTPVGWPPAVAPAIVPRQPRFVAGATVGPLFDVNAGPLTWSPTYPAKIDGARRALEGGAAAPPSDTNAGPLTWQARFPDAIARRPRAIEGVVVGPLTDTNAGPLTWAGEYPDQAPAAPRHPPGGVASPPSDTNAGPLTWAPVAPAAVVRAQRAQPAGEVAPPSDTNAGPLTWAPASPAAVVRRPSMPAGFVVGPLAAPAPAPVLSWRADFPDQVTTIGRALDVGGETRPVAVLPNSPAPSLSWAAVYPDRAIGARRPVNVGGGAAMPELAQPNPLVPMSWASTFPTIVWRRGPLVLSGLAAMPVLVPASVVPDGPTGTGCMCEGPCGCAQRFTSGGGMADWLTPVMDAARDIATQLGLRPYRVMIVRVRWTGAAIGEGREEVRWAREVLPVPQVGDLAGLANTLTAAQVDEMGTILLTKVSASYTEDHVLLRPQDGKPLPPNEAAYYEIRWRDGARRRFVPVGGSSASFRAASAEWQVTLTLQKGARPRSGANR